MTRFPRALALTAALAATPALATDLADMTEAERAAFREEVRAYLLDNPEVLMEAISVLERRQAAEQVANDAALVSTNWEAIFNDGYSHVGGNPEGDVTFVEFMDYQCGYCRKAFPELEELIAADGNIRIIYKELPILGEASVLTSRFAISTQLTHDQDAYGQIHDALITLRGQPSEAVLIALANDLGLDGQAIWDGMGDPKVDTIIGENHMLAQRLQISGTPSFVMGDQLVRGYVPLDAMEQIVAEIRETQG